MAFRHMLKHSNDNYKGIQICSLLVKMTKSFYLSAPRITELTLLIRYGSNEHSHSSQAPIKIFTGWKYLSISVCQTVVNFHSTTIIWSSNKITHTHTIYTVFEAELIPTVTDAINFKLTWSSSIRTFKSICDEVTSQSKTHLNKTFQINTFHKFENRNDIIPPLGIQL